MATRELTDTTRVAWKDINIKAKTVNVDHQPI